MVAQRVGARRRRLKVVRILGAVLEHLVLASIGLLFMVPFFWLVVTSLKLQPQVFTEPPQWIPDPIVWGNYVEALTSPSFPFFRLFGNTLFYSVTSTVAVLFSSAMVAYGFARMEFPGKDTLFAITLSTMMLPGVVTLIPTYILFRWLGWVGTYAPLIAPSFFGSAFYIFMLRQFFMGVPWDLTDAAKVDGAGEFRIFSQVMIPLVKPALLVVAVFNLMWTWNDFMGPLIYLDDVQEFPLVLGLYAFQTRHAIYWNLMMAASLSVMFPMLVMFFAAQRYFIEGVTLSGLKV